MLTNVIRKCSEYREDIHDITRVKTIYSKGSVKLPSCECNNTW